MAELTSGIPVVILTLWVWRLTRREVVGKAS